MLFRPEQNPKEAHGAALCCFVSLLDARIVAVFRISANLNRLEDYLYEQKGSDLYHLNTALESENTFQIDLTPREGFQEVGVYLKGELKKMIRIFYLLVPLFREQVRIFPN